MVYDPWFGEGNGNPFQCSCLENPRDGGAWWAAVYGVAQSRAQLKRLSSSSSSRLLMRMKMKEPLGKIVWQFFKWVSSLHQVAKLLEFQFQHQSFQWIFRTDYLNDRNGFSSSHVWMLELDHKEGCVPRNWHFWIVVLEKALESPLDCNDIKSKVNSKENQSWIFIGRTEAEAESPILWPPDTKSWFTKDSDVEKD